MFPLVPFVNSGRTAAITGGSINGAVIGDTTPTAGTFTTLTATGAITAVTSLGRNVQTITAVGPTALASSAYFVIADATSNNVTITLPAANSLGANISSQIRIKRKDSSGSTCTIQRAGADTIDGGTSMTLGALGSQDFETDGVSAWYKV